MFWKEYELYSIKCEYFLALKYTYFILNKEKCQWQNLQILWGYFNILLKYEPWDYSVEEIGNNFSVKLRRRKLI